jgi:hypothetical protein
MRSSAVAFGACLAVTLLSTHAQADEPSPPPPSSFTGEKEAAVGAAALFGAYGYSAAMAGFVYSTRVSRHETPTKMLIPFLGPVLVLLGDDRDTIESQTLVGGRIIESSKCGDGSDSSGGKCLLALGGLVVMAFEGFLLVASAGAQLTGAVMLGHGLGRMPSEAPRPAVARGSPPAKAHVRVLPTVASGGALGAAITVTSW